MCLRCEQDGKTERHVMPWLTPAVPRKPEHGTLKGCRRHWSAGDSLCPRCASFYDSPEYARALREDKIARLKNRIEILARAGKSTAALEGRLRLLEDPPVTRRERSRKDPTTPLPSVRVRTSLVEDLRTRAAKDGVSFSETVRAALEAYLLL